MSINRRIVVTAVQTMELREEPIPAPAPGEVRVRSTLIGVCGSDTHAFHGRHPFIPIPYMPGHEATGVVEELGEGVTSVAVGDRIVVEPTLPCWDCKPCRSGAENLCENLQFFGCGYPEGGMADQFVVRADRLHVIPDDISDLDAALIEPLSTPVHAARIAGSLQGRTIAVLGAGTIGLLMLAVARWYGASKVVVTDPLPAKREAALRLGADAVVDAMAADVTAQVRAALGESADVVFDCVAVKSTTLAAIGMALKGGTVVIVGVPAADFELPIRIMQDQQIRVQGSATYVPQDFASAIEMIQSGAVRAEDFITGQFPLEQAEQAFEASLSGDHIKVLIHP
ncbi:MAG TPA: alcohol dehydrogenase catalytic domain-containing protein [Propionibacteriaceae bacterium]|nr:alcohol dehydrogenase catalytic domain-containing protein [Propionibacteriaceae bacterium]